MASALLLAHGAGGTVRTNFGALLDNLTCDLPAFGPDFPGSGSSPLPQGLLDLDDLADRLVVAASGVPKFAILGYSMGCAVAIRAAVRFPERVAGLVLTAGSPCIDDMTRTRVRRWRELIDGDRAKLGDFIVSVLFGDPFIRSLTAVNQRDLAELVLWYMQEGTAEQIDLVDRIDVTGDLAHVVAPTLVVGTRHDRLVTPESMRWYADGIPGARWTMLDCGHAVAFEAAAAWARIVDGFLGA